MEETQWEKFIAGVILLSPAVPLWMGRTHDSLRFFCTSATELAESVKLNFVTCKIVKKKKNHNSMNHNPPHTHYTNQFWLRKYTKEFKYICIDKAPSLTYYWHDQYCRPHLECYKSVWRYDIHGKTTDTVQSALSFFFPTI